MRRLKRNGDGAVSSEKSVTEASNGQERSGTGRASESYNIMSLKHMARVHWLLDRRARRSRRRRAASRETARPGARARERRASRAGAGRPAAALPRIVFLGDSLTAGLRPRRGESRCPSLIQARLDAGGYRYEVVNAGVSGDTSAGGLSRLDWSLDGDVAVLVVELGANDGLRGLPVPQMKRNLDEIITAREAARHHGAADRHGGAAELRRGLHHRVPPGRSAIWPTSTT